jgi:hypothetical protein
MIEAEVIEMTKTFGFGGLIFIIWYYDRKQYDKLLRKYQTVFESLKKTLRLLENSNEKHKILMESLVVLIKQNTASWSETKAIMDKLCDKINNKCKNLKINKNDKNN